MDTPIRVHRTAGCLRPASHPAADQKHQRFVIHVSARVNVQIDVGELLPRCLSEETAVDLDGETKLDRVVNGSCETFLSICDGLATACIRQSVLLAVHLPRHPVSHAVHSVMYRLPPLYPTSQLVNSHVHWHGTDQLDVRRENG